MALRILYDNLIANKNFNVLFKTISPSRKFNYFGSNNFIKIFEQYYNINTMYSGYLDNIIRELSSTEYLFFSCHSIYEIYIVKTLLLFGKKVIVGGSAVNLFGINYLKDTLLKLGVPLTTLRSNIIFVSGYVDMTTDLYDIINNWKDFEIKKNNFKTLWYSNISDDTFKNCNLFNRFYCSFNFSVASCWWNKCSFCALTKMNYKNFISGLTHNEIFQSILDIMKKHKSKHVFIADDYISDSKLTKSVLTSLRKNGYKIYVHSGINLLKNEDYLCFANECFDSIQIGLESVSNFTLSKINKGYSVNDVFTAFEKIIKLLNKNIVLRINVILDLPYKNISDVLENYKNLIKIKKELDLAGFKNFFVPIPLTLVKGTELYDNQDYIKIINKKNMNNIHISGIWNIYKFFEKYGVPIQVPDFIVLPISRIDENQNNIPSDLELIEPENFEFLFKNNAFL